MVYDHLQIRGRRIRLWIERLGLVEGSNMLVLRTLRANEQWNILEARRH